MAESALRGEARQLAKQIATNPRLRARFLEDPWPVVNRVVPGRRFWLGEAQGTHRLRREVIAAFGRISKGDPELSSSAHAETVIKQFFDEAIRNPQISFMTIIGMSCTAFLIGLAFIATGLFIGVQGGGTTNDTAVAAIFGVSGLSGSLGAVFALARSGISLANANHAQIRLILTAFATELGHLRALNLKELDEVAEVNLRIRQAMNAAVDLIQENVKTSATHEPAKGTEPTPTALAQPGGAR